MDPPNFLGATMIDIDIDTNNNTSNDLPTWLRDMLDRAFTATGIRSKKKIASEEAIASLQHVDINQLESEDCPICYDKYEVETNNPNSKVAKVTKDVEGEVENPVKLWKRQIHQSQDEMIKELSNKFNIPLQSNSEANQFNDPSFFFPIDQGGVEYSRFPQRNIHTLEQPTKEDILPGYNEIMKERSTKQSQEELTKNCGHGPVKMPNCNHVFGKSCIIEWLKNNVSCPLCRQEVEELKEKDPKQLKIERLKQVTMNNFNSEEDNLEHLLNHSTDVFNPFRRPFNPSITPLTDSSMSQTFASPSYTLTGNSWEPVNSREPNLVLPGKFPLPDFHSLIPVGATRTFTIGGERSRRFNRANNDNNTNDNNTNNSNDRNNNQNDEDDNSSSNSDSMSDDASSNSSSPSADGHEFNVARGAEDPNDNNSDTSSSGTRTARANRNTWVWSTLFGRGGPERSRRSTTNGRQHPYFRPSPSP